MPDGDLFEAINSGKATVVTGEIATFTETGLELIDGRHIDADIVITATGFELNVLGDIAFTIDDRPLDFHDTVTYLGAMFTGIPNMVWVFGYFRAAWTLRADMIARFVCRLLAHMEDKGAEVVVPRLRPGEEDMPLHPWIDPENFNPGYLRRGLHLLPQQGDRRALVAHAGLLAREGMDPERRSRRRRARLRVARRVHVRSGGKRDGRPFVAI